MIKRVELSSAAYRWLLRHHFISEEVIIGVVLHCPEDQRIYLNKDRFQISFKRKKNKKFVEITLWIEERPSSFFVYKIHSIGKQV